MKGTCNDADYRDTIDSIGVFESSVMMFDEFAINKRTSRHPTSKDCGGDRHGSSCRILMLMAVTLIATRHHPSIGRLWNGREKMLTPTMINNRSDLRGHGTLAMSGIPGGGN